MSLISPPVSGQQDVEIFDPIQIDPDSLVFPWDPIWNSSYKYQIKVCLQWRSQGVGEKL